MCLGYEGTVVEVSGSGVGRHATLVVEDRRFRIGLAFVPEAQEGDRVLAHSGQGVRVISNSSKKLSERA